MTCPFCAHRQDRVIDSRESKEGDVIRHCLGRLAKFKVPQSVTFVDVLPRNATGKVLKRELRTQFVGADKPAIS